MRPAIRNLAAATALAAVTLLASANAATIAWTDRAVANTAAWSVPAASIAGADGDIFLGQGDVNSPLALATDPGPNQLPEPGTLLLLGAGLLVLGLIRRRRRS